MRKIKLRKVAKRWADKISSRKFKNLEKKHFDILDDKSVIVKKISEKK
jgi:hypothetical protein